MIEVGIFAQINASVVDESIRGFLRTPTAKGLEPRASYSIRKKNKNEIGRNCPTLTIAKDTQLNMSGSQTQNQTSFEPLLLR